MQEKIDPEELKAVLEMWMPQGDRFADIVVLFRGPKGDGPGIKRFVGPLIDAGSAAMLFAVQLHADGGVFICAEFQIDGETAEINKAEWLAIVRSSGLAETLFTSLPTSGEEVK